MCAKIVRPVSSGDIKYVVGIDNGSTGYFTIVDTTGKRVYHTKTPVLVMPYLTGGDKTVRYRRINFVTMIKYLRRIISPHEKYVIYAERPYINPKGFYTSMFAMHNWLLLCELIQLSGEQNFNVISARAWQKEFIPEAKGRKEIKAAANTLFKDTQTEWINQNGEVDDSDSYFIALHGLRRSATRSRPYNSSRSIDGFVWGSHVSGLLPKKSVAEMLLGG